MVIKFKLKAVINSKHRQRILFRNKRNLNEDELLQVIIDEMNREASDFCEYGFENKRCCLNCYISLFRSIAGRLYENMCPLIEKEIVVKDNAPWYDYEVSVAKRVKRKKREKVEKCKRSDFKK